ncbi:MAG: family 10 glycosylhydrolase [Planctomycetota bacterium]|jgi:uncharacterized lipoprotein YddW (UPF0748 family)|nr:family 10 glycosylhydrolase [Planctomycetota bacterium]MDP6763600.1 family 10 glycosylhydrolase [Planctomycetota bacterium]MDP6988451.1 family 10 glycosylhydrolase [Planctomycetota bacterium]
MTQLVLRLVLILSACAPTASAAEPVRAIWITRWDYRTRDDVERIVEHCADAGFDTLLFQVRGNATAFYRSSLEPWAEQLGWADPGFDPMATAIAAARRRGVALHAWVNVVPAWWGPDPPTDRAHVVHTHPEWLWFDAQGRRQAFSPRFYVSLNPCLPEVREYLVAVLAELLEEYAVDGLHLDYIRFPNEPPAQRPDQDFPRDVRTLALYREATGLAPDEDPGAWDGWRAEQVTELVRAIAGARDRVRPDAELSAAVGAEAEAALSHHQDWRRWIAEGLLERVFPMNYTADPARFERRMEAWSAFADRVSVVMGLRAGSVAPEVLIERMRWAERSMAGFGVFMYADFHDSQNTVIDVQTPERSRERAALRKAVLPHLRGS